MITLRRGGERQHLQSSKHDIWRTFYPDDDPGPLADGFGILALFDETRLAPGGTFGPTQRDAAETVTYVYRGALAQDDSTGSSEVICAGEFQCMTTSRSIRHKETSASRTDWVHIFQITLRPSKVGLARAQEQKRFTAAQRRNALCVVASVDARGGSLHVHQDAFIYSCILDRGRHLVHKLVPGRSAWLHIIDGEATLNETILTQGDGVGVTSEPSVSLTVQESAEILLVDLGAAPSSCDE